MSRLKERKEKNCLNCNAEVQGKYCQNCGQENIEPKETVWHLVDHFFRDITHFDGNFFSTLKFLFTRPGFLSKEYMIGRRASYINPVRMYIFTSAFFFLIFFNFFKTGSATVEPIINKKTITQISRMDSATFADFSRAVNLENNKKDMAMSRAEFNKYADTVLKSGGIKIPGINYKSKAAYDSALRTGKKEHNWLERQLVYKIIAVNKKYENNPRQMIASVQNSLMHSLPQMLFISLPLLALLLKWLYYRRKQFYYVNHAIFSIHLYIFIFIVLLVSFSLNALNNNYLHWGSLFSWINTAFFFGTFFYVYKAMRKFYLQRRAKTIVKFLLLCFMFLILMLLLFVGFVLFSFFTI